MALGYRSLSPRDVRADPARAQGAPADAADEEAAVHSEGGRLGESVLPRAPADGCRGQDSVQAADVVDVEVALAKKELKSDLPTSVFAPPKEVMSRQRNKLFGTVEGAAYLAKTSAATKAKERSAQGAVDGEEDDGPGVFVPDPNDLFAPPDKTYFPDPFEVAAGLSTKMPVLKDVSHPTTFGHRLSPHATLTC